MSEAMDVPGAIRQASTEYAYSHPIKKKKIGLKVRFAPLPEGTSGKIDRALARQIQSKNINF